MKKIILISILMVAIKIGNAQVWQWANDADSPANIVGICTDNAGNTVVTGQYSSGGPNIVFGPLTATTTGGPNLYIAKYDPAGVILWLKCTSLNALNSSWGTAVSTDAAGNVYLTGGFSGDSVVLGSFTLVNPNHTNDDDHGIDNILIAKYDPNGNVLWAKTAFKNDTTDCWGGTSISAESNGNFYVTGEFKGDTLALDSHTLTNSDPSHNNIFVAKCNTNGSYSWVNQPTIVDGDVREPHVSYDAAGNVYVTGNYLGEVAFGTHTLTQTFNYELFIVKYDPNGNVIWAKNSTSQAPHDAVAFSSCTDVAGNIYVSGYFSGTNIVIGTYSLSNSNTNQSQKNMFVAKLDGNGNVLFIKNSGGSGSYIASSIVASGNSFYVAISGNLSTTPKTIILDTYTTTSLFTPGLVYPVFIAQYDLNGNALNVTSLADGGYDISPYNSGNKLSTNENCKVHFGSVYRSAVPSNNPFMVGTYTFTPKPFSPSMYPFVAKLEFDKNCPEVTTDLSINHMSGLKVNMFPNPTNGVFKIELDEQIEGSELILMNTMGQIVYEQKLAPGLSEVNCTLSSGVYQYTILKNKHAIAKGKLIVN